MSGIRANMTHPGVDPYKIKMLTNYDVQLEALADELIATPDPAVQVALENKIRQIEAKKALLKQEIERLRRGSPDPIVSERAWREKLHEIDFKGPARAFNGVVQRMPKDCGAALFLMHDGFASAASLFVARMIAELRRPVGLTLKPRFSGTVPSPTELMGKLAGYFNIAQGADADALAADFLRTLVASLIPGQVVLLDMECGSVANATEFLGWFLERFWSPLVQALAARRGGSGRPGIRGPRVQRVDESRPARRRLDLRARRLPRPPVRPGPPGDEVGGGRHQRMVAPVYPRPPVPRHQYRCGSPEHPRNVSSRSAGAGDPADRVVAGEDARAFDLPDLILEPFGPGLTTQP